MWLFFVQLFHSFIRLFKAKHGPSGLPPPAVNRDPARSSSTTRLNGVGALGPAHVNTLPSPSLPRNGRGKKSKNKPKPAAKQKATKDDTSRPAPPRNDTELGHDTAPPEVLATQRGKAEQTSAMIPFCLPEIPEFPSLAPARSPSPPPPPNPPPFKCYLPPLLAGGEYPGPVHEPPLDCRSRGRWFAGPFKNTQLSEFPSSDRLPSPWSPPDDPAPVKIWTSSPNGKQGPLCKYPDFDFALGSAHDTSFSPFSSPGSSYFVPYFDDASTISSASDMLNFSVYVDGPDCEVGESYLDDDSFFQQHGAFGVRMPTTIYDPAVRDVFTRGQLDLRTVRKDRPEALFSEWCHTSAYLGSPNGMLTPPEDCDSPSPLSSKERGKAHLRTISSPTALRDFRDGKGLSDPCALSTRDVFAALPGSSSASSITSGASRCPLSTAERRNSDALEDIITLLDQAVGQAVLAIRDDHDEGHMVVVGAEAV
ncbi:hypothetical protein BV22DRAFT_1042353 [Leucogyrophana mollusca]|uniref:Uncharacterized protein n=1 Tax=Leucogyrophana mollusca TaxID=85980 RepID=A0ACB8AVK9_9AGAM|nr:hypothetical protein BV22DRAFT_1042353 [Leucogyrophana mollusca]